MKRYPVNILFAQRKKNQENKNSQKKKINKEARRLGDMFFIPSI